MSPLHKAPRWLKAQVKSPPIGADARRHAGLLLRSLPSGGLLGLPESRPMPSIGANVHELRIRDGKRDWRVIYRIDHDAIVIAAVFEKRTQKTPKRVVETAQLRLKEYDDA